MKRLDNGVDRLNLCQLRFAFLISLLIGGESGLAFLKLLLALFKLYLTGCDGGDAFIICLMSLGELGGVGVIGRLTLFKLRLTGGKLRTAGIVGAEAVSVRAYTVGIDVGIRGKLRNTGIHQIEVGKSFFTDLFPNFLAVKLVLNAYAAGPSAYQTDQCKNCAEDSEQYFLHCVYPPLNTDLY